MKFGHPKKLKFQIFSELISYVISIYFDYKIEYFDREKPLHLNTFVQIEMVRGSNDQGVKCPGIKYNNFSVALNNVLHYILFSILNYVKIIVERPGRGWF